MIAVFEHQCMRLVESERNCSVFFVQFLKSISV